MKKATIKNLQNLSFLLLICLSYLSSYGQTSTAPAGAGTSANPYQISTWQNLYWVSQNTSS